jgi:uncharacterized protein (DUF58 family)
MTVAEQRGRAIDDAEEVGASLLSPALLGRLERLQLGTRRRLAGRFSGEHRSVRHGSSLDFADEREYHQGDDFRRIDYPLWARTDQLFVKLFEAEDDVTIRLMLDTSASMGLHGKLRQAARAAAAIGFVALVRRDAVQLHTFPAETPPRRFVGRAASSVLLAHLDGLVAQGRTDVVIATMDLLARPGQRGVTVLVSDLLTPRWADAIDRLPARGDDLAVVHLLSRHELAPDLVGDLDLVDAESGARVAVSLSTDALASYRSSTRRWLDEVQDRVRHVGATYVRLLAEDDLEAVLLRHWHDEGVLR